MECNPTGSELVIGRGNGSLQLFQKTNLKHLKSKHTMQWNLSHQIQGHRWAITELEFLNDKELITCGLDGELILWYISKGILREKKTKTLNYKLNCLAIIDKEQKWVAVGGLKKENLGEIDMVLF